MLIIEAALFVGTWIQTGHGSIALDVATGSKSPFDPTGAGGAWTAVGLSTFSWLLAPALIGAVVALLLGRVIAVRLLTDPQVQAKATAALKTAQDTANARTKAGE